MLAAILRQLDYNHRMVPLANLNGEILLLDQVKVSALDRGFLFGDGVYEGLHLLAGKVRFLDDHMARLRRSLGEVRITGVDLEQLVRRIYQTIDQGSFRDGFIYVQITRGAASRRTHYFPPEPVQPTVFFFIEPFVDPYAQDRQQGIKVITHADLRWGRCDIKTVNLLGNVLAAQAAREGGAIEALLVRADGSVTEASRSSLFGVVNGTLRTFPMAPAILPGVTRGKVLGLIRELKLPLEERALVEPELRTASELFLTGTTAEVLPIVQVNDFKVGMGQPGPIVRQLQTEFHRRYGA